MGIKALLLAKVERFDEAIQTIEEVLDSSTGVADQPELLYSAAQIYALAGQRDAMLRYAESAMRAGYPREEFRRAPEFHAYQDDPELTRLLVASFEGP